MDTSPEAEEELRRQRHREREEDMERMEREVIWPQIIIAVMVILALWALNKYLEEEVRRQETIEYKQERLKEPKLSEPH